MKYTNFRAFEKHLEASRPDHFAAIYVVLAKDQFERKAAFDRLICFLQGNEHQAQFSLTTLEAESLSDSVVQELYASSLFTKKQILVIAQAEKLKAKAKEILEQYFAKPNHSLFLVLSAESLVATTNFYKKAEKAGVILDLNQPEKPWEKEQRLAEWIKAYVTTQGKKIELSTCQYMLQQLGTDQSLLFQELEKLVCFIGDRLEITVSDVSTICLSTNMETGWQLGEAIFKKDSRAALRIAKALLKDGTACIALLRQIRTQFQTEFQVCSILANGGTAADVGSLFPYMKGNILNRHMQMAQGYGIARFQQGLIQIDKTEVLTKNSSIDPELLMDLLLVKLTVSS